MSLSSGTLNLKFMQRAAAAKAAANPASAPSTPAKAGTPVPATPPIATTPSASVATPSNDEDRWSLPRRSAPAPAPASAGPSRRVQVSFVSSYLPFLEDAPAVTHGAGRRAFGGFGEKPEEEAEELEEDSDEEALAAIMGNDEEMQDVVPTRKEKSKGKEKAKEKAKKPKAKAGDEETAIKQEDAPRTFMRPAGFEPAQKAKPASTGLKTSAADKMRATIAGMKKVSVSPSASGTSTPTNASAGKKRAHLGTDEDAAKRPRKNANDAPKAKAEKKMTLDQREKAIKAAKKAAKKNKAT